MRQVIAGNGVDSTAAVLAYLKAGNSFFFANLYLIGWPDDPKSIWLTDWESPLSWPYWTNEKVAPGFPKAYDPGVITRGAVSTKIGLEVQSLDIKWTPPSAAFTLSTATASPYQLAQIGYYDNWPVRVWTAYMPTRGDANTFGASPLFGGRVADSTTERGVLTFSVNSFLDVVNQYVPTNVIEVVNSLASYAGATPPSGLSAIPQLNVITTSSTNVIVGDTTSPSLHHIFGTNVLKGGYLVFNDPAGATVGRLWSGIQQNIQVTIGGNNYNQIVIYTPLPWPPTPGVDTFYISGAAPIDKADGDYFGFPYVPAPELAV